MSETKRKRKSKSRSRTQPLERIQQRRDREYLCVANTKRKVSMRSRCFSKRVPLRTAQTQSSQKLIRSSQLFECQPSVSHAGMRCTAAGIVAEFEQSPLGNNAASKTDATLKTTEKTFRDGQWDHTPPLPFLFGVELFFLWDVFCVPLMGGAAGRQYELDEIIRVTCGLSFLEGQSSTTNKVVTIAKFKDFDHAKAKTQAELSWPLGNCSESLMHSAKVAHPSGSSVEKAMGKHVAHESSVAPLPYMSEKSSAGVTDCAPHQSW